MSSTRQKWTLVASVLAGGTAGALLYLKPFDQRTEQPAAIPPLAAAADAGELRGKSLTQAEAPRELSQPSRPELSLNAPPQPVAPQMPLKLDPPPGAAPPKQLVLTKPPVEPTPEAQPTAEVKPAPAGDSPFAVRPPQMPADFPRSEVPPQAAAKEPTGATPRVEVPASPRQEPPRDTAEVRTARPAPRERLHVVRDGDTLRKLAERYLGDSRRHLEIFTDNRSVLKSPDVLPIGAKLRIITGPPRIVETVVEAPAGTAPIAAGNSGDALPAGQGLRPLVPLPPGAFADRAP